MATAFYNIEKKLRKVDDVKNGIASNVTKKTIDSYPIDIEMLQNKGLKIITYNESNYIID